MNFFLAANFPSRKQQSNRSMNVTVFMELGSPVTMPSRRSRDPIKSTARPQIF